MEDRYCIQVIGTFDGEDWESIFEHYEDTLDKAKEFCPPEHLAYMSLFPPYCYCKEIELLIWDDAHTEKDPIETIKVKFD